MNRRRFLRFCLAVAASLALAQRIGLERVRFGNREIGNITGLFTGGYRDWDGSELFRWQPMWFGKNSTLRA